MQNDFSRHNFSRIYFGKLHPLQSLQLSWLIPIRHKIIDSISYLILENTKIAQENCTAGCVVYKYQYRSKSLAFKKHAVIKYAPTILSNLSGK